MTPKEEWARSRGTVSNILYRAYPTKRDFSFTFEWLEGSWRIHINTVIDYGHQNPGAYETHRLGLPQRQYICWTDRIETVSGAQAIAALWADSTEHYIATGSFEPPPGRPGVVSDISPLGTGRATTPARAAQSVTRRPQPTPPPSPPPRPQPSSSTVRTGQSRWDRFLDQFFG